MSINLTSILFWLVNQWFWFSIFASAYVVGIFIFFNDDISVNSLVLSGNSKKDAIEKHNYVKKNMTWDIMLLDICSYLPLLIMCWIPVYHIFFFLSINELAFGVDIDSIEKEREKNEQEMELKKKQLQNKKSELMDLLNEISAELKKQKKDEDFISEQLTNNSTNKIIDSTSIKKLNSDSSESEFSESEISKSQFKSKKSKDDDWDNYTEL